MKKKPKDSKIFFDKKHGPFTSFQVVEFLTIRQERFQEWLHKGFIKPYEPATGRGTKNKFSKKNLYEIALFSFLLKGGFLEREASKILQTDIMDPITQFEKRSMKMFKKNIPFESTSPVLVIYRTGNKYSSEAIFDEKISLDIKFDIVGRNVDEIQIINIGKLIWKVNNALSEIA